MTKPEKIQQLYKQLINQPVNYFPASRTRWQLTNEHGVYIIYSPKHIVLHVGKTSRGKNGLKQRMYNHLHNASSFSGEYLSKRNLDLRKGFYFRFLVVKETRERAYLENLASGMLCPEHIGTSERKSD